MADHLDGFRALDKQLAELADPKATGSVLRSGAGYAMRRVAKQAKAEAPVGRAAHRTYKGRLVAPGFAARSVRVVTKLSRDKQKVSAVLGVRKEAFYALQFIELGTSHVPAKPWLVPTFERNQRQIITDIKAGMVRRLAKIVAMRRQ